MINILKKIIIYNYIYNNINYFNKQFIKNTIISITTITRQSPLFLFNKNLEIIALKTTLRNKNLNNFLYKLKKFTLSNSTNTSLFRSKIYNLDSNYNLYIYIKNQKYFFEHFKSNILTFLYNFNIQLIFNKNTKNKNKIKYILNTLNIKL
uniref:Ribosomal protein L5 n=1 Tax=Babesia duncani TaxID=323732 RepID=A0A385GNJ0_9APIC|nr:ribosomal protein L5 [Babesia duncani]